MAVSKRLKAIYMSFFDGIETWTANRISDLQEWRKLNKYIDRKSKLTKAQIREVKTFWKPYCHVSTKWCQYYASQNGIFDPRYIPNTLYFSKIDQHFNNRKLGWGFNDKNYYSLIFPDISQPRTLVRKIGNLLFDEKYYQITAEEAISIIKTEKEVIIKPAQESGSARGIEFIDTIDDEAFYTDFLNNPNEKNYVVQAVVQQHKDLEAVHPGSLNTIRVTTLMMEDGIHILSAVLRMGAGDSRVDNASAGGVSVGIGEDGKLNPYGHILYGGEKTKQHPQGFVFEGASIPQYDVIIETVKRAAQYIGNFRLVSWDMAVDYSGNVLLVEANMRKGGIAIHQFNNGPLFGDLTERVLKEVFGEK